MKQRVYLPVLLTFLLTVFIGSTAVITLAQNKTTDKETAVSDHLTSVPLAVNSCPSPLRIMPVGDSITYGIGSTGSGSDGTNGGYRGTLLTSLTNAGHTIDYVGTETDPTGLGFDNEHEGHPGVETKFFENSIFFKLKNRSDAGTPANVVLLHIGTNNITVNDTTTTSLETLLNSIDSYEATYNPVTVILAQIINRPCDMQPASSCTTKVAQTSTYNDNIATLVQARVLAGDDIRLINMEDNAGFDYSAGSSDFAPSDDKHPSNAGYTKMATMWFNEIEDYLVDCATPTAATITSTAVTNAVVGQQYQYDVNATGTAPISYALTQKPSGMSIDSGSGLITWTPNGSQITTHDVTVVATNSIGSGTQDFTITVNSAPTKPTITSTAVTSAAPGQQYSYQVQATGFPNPTFSLTTKPSGMDIDANSGIITWTPGVDSGGSSETVTVRATNSEGNDTQSFTINVNNLVFIPFIIK